MIYHALTMQETTDATAAVAALTPVISAFDAKAIGFARAEYAVGTVPPLAITYRTLFQSLLDAEMAAAVAAADTALTPFASNAAQRAALVQALPLIGYIRNKRLGFEASYLAADESPAAAARNARDWFSAVLAGSLP